MFQQTPWAEGQLPMAELSHWCGVL